MNNSRPTQCDRIMRHLKDHNSITQAEAMKEYGIMRLASRMTELKKRAVPIKKEWVHSLNRYGESVRYLKYSLAEVKDKDAENE